LVAEFQYNNKKHLTTEYTPFKLNYERYLWKKDLTIGIEFPKLETSLEGLKRSWEVTMLLVKKAQETIKRQFDKKR